MTSALRQYLHGWRIFAELYLAQRRKKHGAGRRDRRSAVYIAMCGRWLVDGQWRGGRYPRMPDGTRFDEYLKQHHTERQHARQSKVPDLPVV